MEKIYMNEYKNKKLKKKKSPFLLSITFSLLIIASLYITSLFDISYAIPEIGKVLPDNFISAQPGAPEYRTKGFTSGFLVNKFSTKDGDIVFCLEHDVTYFPDVEYSKNDVIKDSGLIYLMANLYPNKRMTLNGEEIDERAQIWISQSAIWIYLNESGYSKNTLSVDTIRKIREENSLIVGDSLLDRVIDLSDEPNMSLYNKFGINQLIEDAKKLKNLKSNELTVSRASQNIVISDDNKYYQTDLISVNGKVASTKIGTFSGFELILNNAPKGTMIIGEDGNEIKKYNNLSPGTKFSIKVPAESLTNDNKKIKIAINGSFDSYFANSYVGFTTEHAASQKVTNVKKVYNNLSIPLEIEINHTPKVPDTSDFKSYTYIFTGIIMLISGIGIFLANVKKN